MIKQIRYALNPVIFARDVLKITPDPWQQEVMMSPSKRILLNCSRQSGKSTSSSIIALWTALYKPGALVLLISPSLRQSSELFKKVQGFYRLVPDQPPLPEDNRLSMTMGNGSRIVSLPSSEANIRGFSGVSLIIEDESSRVDDNLYRAVRPMLATSDGKIMLMSTPWGKRGHFFESWISSEDWKRIEISAAMCPRISPVFLEEERKALGDWFFEQEYCCQFCETVDSLFSYNSIMAAMDDDLEPLFPITTQEIKPLPGISDDLQPIFTGVS